MDLVKIRKGNSFQVEITLYDKDNNQVNPIEVSDIKVILLPQFNKPSILNYTIDGEVIKVHITEKLNCNTGIYRIGVVGIYNGEKISRDPRAFEIVNHVEQEETYSIIAIEETPIYHLNVSFAIASSGSSGIESDPIFSAWLSENTTDDGKLNSDLLPLSSRSIQDPEIFISSGENTFTLSKVPAFIVSIYVTDEVNFRASLEDEDYSLVGNQLTISNPEIQSGYKIKVIYSA